MVACSRGRMQPAMLLILLPSAVALNHVPLGSASSEAAQSCGYATTRLAQPDVGNGAEGRSPLGWAAARTRRSGGVRCGLLSGLKIGDSVSADKFDEGAQVRVTSSINFMHVPGHKKGFDAKDAVGTVLRVYEEANLSADRAVKVRFEEPKRWIGHFAAGELKAVE